MINKLIPPPFPLSPPTHPYINYAHCFKLAVAVVAVVVVVVVAVIVVIVAVNL